jgi:hypothetical protein
MQGASLRHQALEGTDLEIVLQQLVEGVAAEIFGAARQRIALLRIEPTHLDQAGYDLELDLT